MHVSPARHQRGRAQWLGTGPGQSFERAQATKRALAGANPVGVVLSRRAEAAISELRSQFDWLRQTPETTIVRDPKGSDWWWSFAGTAANRELAAALGPLIPATTSSDLAVRLADATPRGELGQRLRTPLETTLDPPADLEEAYKFSDLLPADAAVAMFAARDRDPLAVGRIVALPVRDVRLSAPAPRP